MSLRPTTLKEIAQRSDSIGDFGRHLRDWLHELRRVSSRAQAAATIADEPPRLRDKFPRGEIAKQLALKVAKELDLPDDWLNDQVKQFLAEKEAKRQLNDADFGKGLRVSVPTAAYLLAMKLRACRPPLPGYPGDYGDIQFLVQKMGITSVEAAETIHDKFFPHDVLSDTAREVVRGAIQPTQP